MQFKTKDTATLLSKTFSSWNDKDPFRQSAVIAYYAIFSIPGLLVLIISIAGYFFGNETVNQNILEQISSTMGSETSKQISQILIKSTQSKSTVWGSIIGVLILLVGSTAVFVELQKSLNLIWRVEVAPQNGFFTILKARLFSFGLILAIAFLLLVSLVVSTALSSMADWVKDHTDESTIVFFNIINFVFSFAVISVLFALMFKILPDAKIKWKHVWLGAIVTGILFTIGKTILAFYFSTADPASIYGVAGSVVIILLWVSYSSMILFFGAEFTAVYAKFYSGTIPPTEIAKKESVASRKI
ncbi:YihY/virulence factor BrkB family protein [Flavobacterium sp. XN-5]|uniref:YihY/virulence factor BrkB family protein n=1 Tax=Flavobacterium sp. XN-5 TaxID=2599390 RepID=UPI0011C86014|nr:YihY/virulence factor BrkB family protein [Flavobacterium sp. XN-5]NGY38820.1 YihY/virulence factor BrkB family protein [Flavobacterium sp. XN-5]